MYFDFEQPNQSPTMLQTSTAHELTSDMMKIPSQPPQYDGRTFDDLAATDGVEQFDKLDAYYLAEKRLSEFGHKYATSETSKIFTKSIKK